MIMNTENGPTAATEVSLAGIEASAKRFADARAELGDVVRLLNDQVEALKRAALPDIKRGVAKAAAAHGKLRDLLEAGPGLFVKPRTVIFHGIKVGYEKGKGKIECADPDKSVALIEKLFPDQAETLICVKKSLVKSALANLSVGDLKRIGCTIEETADMIIIRPTDSGVDKIVTALLKEATEEVQSPKSNV
jgi:hypothetical protein